MINIDNIYQKFVQSLDPFIRAGISKQNCLYHKIIKTFIKLVIKAGASLPKGNRSLLLLSGLAYGTLATCLWFKHFPFICWPGVGFLLVHPLFLFLMKHRPARAWTYRLLTEEWVLSQVGDPDSLPILPLFGQAVLCGLPLFSCEALGLLNPGIMTSPPMEAGEGEERVVNPRPRVAEIGEETPDLPSLEVSAVGPLQEEINGLFSRPAFWSKRYIVDPSDARSHYIREYRDGYDGVQPPQDDIFLQSIRDRLVQAPQQDVREGGDVNPRTRDLPQLQQELADLRAGNVQLRQEAADLRARRIQQEIPDLRAQGVKILPPEENPRDAYQLEQRLQSLRGARLFYVERNFNGVEPPQDEPMLQRIRDNEEETLAYLNNKTLEEDIAHLESRRKLRVQVYRHQNNGKLPRQEIDIPGVKLIRELQIARIQSLYTPVYGENPYLGYLGKLLTDRDVSYLFKPDLSVNEGDRDTPGASGST